MKSRKTPKQHATKVVEFPRLDGGLNLWEMDYRVPNNQTPDMENLWWQDGVLQCRDGQTYVYGPSDEQLQPETFPDVAPWVDTLGTGYASTQELFWDHAFFHIGDKIYYMALSVTPELGETREMQLLCSGVPEKRGTFFLCNDWLFYKNPGGFFKIKYTPDGENLFEAEDMRVGAYAPTILMNADPHTGAGDEYQPENRLSPQKTVQYNAAETVEICQEVSPNGVDKRIVFGAASRYAALGVLTGLDAVYFDNVLVNPTSYRVYLSTGAVKFDTAPAADVLITAHFRVGVVDYKLPVVLAEGKTETETVVADGNTVVFKMTKSFDWVEKIAVHTGTLDGVYDEDAYEVDVAAQTVTFINGITPNAGYEMTFHLIVATEVQGAVDKVVVDGKVLTEVTDYNVDRVNGVIHFVSPPPVHNPFQNNTVEITYSKENPDAMNAIMDCPYAVVYGGEGNVCIVLGGCTSQPNAFFWNSNDSVSMNESYWPISYYNLAGASEDAITGFGLQYSNLILFKERSVGKVAYGIETVNDRDAISLTYRSINGKIGCDLPWTIQLIENNLVFCNTESGAHIIRDTTAALENQIECISRNVNGTEQRPGLLFDVREVDRNQVCGFDDGNRYWVCANGKAYLWDYLLSGWKEPSWFYFTAIPGIAYLKHTDRMYHLDANGRVTMFARIFMDYMTAINKVYQFPPQFFDTYDRLKDVLYCVFTVRSDTDSIVDVLYQTDYEDRFDMTPVYALSWKLTPRNLAFRCLSTNRFAHVARRSPGCRHIRHFAMRLTNNEPAQDLAILSAQIYFRYLGRDR